MHLFTINEQQVWIAEARHWSEEKIVKMGIVASDLQKRMDRGQSVNLAQLYGIVCKGLIMTEHIFQGLRRPMSVGGDRNADKEKLIYVWRARRDVSLKGLKTDLKLEFRDAPPNRVFSVCISPNKMIREFAEIAGWIEHWTWISADPENPSMPVDWGSRYEEHLIELGT